MDVYSISMPHFVVSTHGVLTTTFWEEVETRKSTPVITILICFISIEPVLNRGCIDPTLL
jgi:hypothetical protein